MELQREWTDPSLSGLDACSSMIHYQNYFGGEAIRTAVDLNNLSLSAPLDGDILKWVWTEKDVCFKHLRVFGCQVFVHISKDERSNLMWNQNMYFIEL